MKCTRIRKLKVISHTLLATAVIIFGGSVLKERVSAIIGKVYKAPPMGGSSGNRGVTNVTGGNSTASGRLGGGLTSGGTGGRGLTSGGTSGSSGRLTSGSITTGGSGTSGNGNVTLTVKKIGGGTSDPGQKYTSRLSLQLSGGRISGASTGGIKTQGTGGSGDTSGTGGAGATGASGQPSTSTTTSSSSATSTGGVGTTGATGTGVGYADITRGIQDITQKLKNAVSDYDKRTGSGGGGPLGPTRPTPDLKGLAGLVDDIDNLTERMKRTLQSKTTGSAGTTGTSGQPSTSTVTGLTNTTISTGGTTTTTTSSSTTASNGGGGITPQDLQRAKASLNRTDKTQHSTGGTGKGPLVTQKDLDNTIKKLKHVDTKVGGSPTDPQKQPGAHGVTPEDLLEGRYKLKPVKNNGGGDSSELGATGGSSSDGSGSYGATHAGGGSSPYKLYSLSGDNSGGSSILKKLKDGLTGNRGTYSPQGEEDTNGLSGLGQSGEPGIKIVEGNYQTDL